MTRAGPLANVFEPSLSKAKRDFKSHPQLRAARTDEQAETLYFWPAYWSLELTLTPNMEGCCGYSHGRLLCPLAVAEMKERIVDEFSISCLDEQNLSSL